MAVVGRRSPEEAGTGICARRVTFSRNHTVSHSWTSAWVKLGLDVATEALRWGVNDLGGTLMEQRITRMAGGEYGVRLDPGQLIAAAHAAGRPAAERTSLSAIREHFEPAVSA